MGISFWGPHATHYRWLVPFVSTFSVGKWDDQIPSVSNSVFCKPVFPFIPGGGLCGDGLHQGPPRGLPSYVVASLFVLSVDCVIFK